MRKTSSLILWGLAGLAGTAVLVWGYPRAAPFQPRPWRTTAGQAEAKVLDHLRQLGRGVERAYVVTRIDETSSLERRLQMVLPREGLARLRQTGLPEQVKCWEVTVYAPDAIQSDYAVKGEVSLTSGRLMALHFRVDSEAKGAAIAPAVARARADAVLRAQGVDLGRYDAPEVRTQQLTGRVDTTLRYSTRQPLADGGGYGMEVTFAGEVLSDVGPWIDQGAPQRAAKRSLQSTQVGIFAQFLFQYGLLAVLAVLFLKRYHEGEIGVRRPGQLFLTFGGAGLLYLLMVARAASRDQPYFAFATPQQASWFFVLVGFLFFLLPTSLLGTLAWSVGEWACRERWGQKLATFDALFQRRWANASVARSALSGLLAGLAIAGFAVGMLLLLEPAGAWPQFALFYSIKSAWTGIEVAVGDLATLIPQALAIGLCVLPAFGRWLGRPLGFLLTALVTGVVSSAPVLVLPFAWGVLFSTVFSAALLGVFLALDLLAFVLASLVSIYLLIAFPLLAAADPILRAEGWAGLAILALPLFVSVRHLGSRREVVYHYEDVPPHVRRIAERERQRVELDTARRIQSSILPDLPPRLAGVDVAHAYLPATEVGGDFYDVLALEDGRLAVAVGDVAGHGVSSGLVMSMAKSALAVQVAFDPEVESVFRTLNRTVHQTARKRLLATLSYALLDPVRRELLYASAGHLFPYRISTEGKVEALEAGGYPLGVRRDLEVEPHLARLDPGDTLFLFSDGLVEARAEGSDDLFGFERLEESLGRHAGESVEGLRDRVLADVAGFARGAQREDDMTVLVLRLPQKG